jgi:hypothetical protein
MGVPAFIKVCDLDELPPGKGRVVRVGSRDVYVYNREGRVFAAVEERATSISPLAGEPPSCHHRGASFDVEQEDSPARARAHTAAVAVTMREDGVFVELDDSGAPIEIDQPARAF